MRRANRRMAAVRARWMRGVSLIEALVSLAILSFGMLGVVGVQATLRYNAEVSKQRSEAVRIGQEEMETLRSFVQQAVDGAGVRRSYSDMAGGTSSTTYAGPLATNTTFTVERQVTDPGNGVKGVRVQVSWSDRNGRLSSISLASQVSGLGPDSTADLLRRETFSQPDAPVRDRHVSIPVEAQTLVLDGTLSVFKPPLNGTTAGTVAWVFNNSTGLIVGQCTVAAGTTTAELSYWNLAWCSSNTSMHLLSGAVRFSTGPTPPTAADAESPISPALNLDMQLSVDRQPENSIRTGQCFDDAPMTVVAAAAQVAVRYYCAIPINRSGNWQGTVSVIEPQPNPAIPAAQTAERFTAATFSVCRYTTALNDAEWVPNERHPRRYGYLDASVQSRQVAPMGNLVEQNFLVIRAGFPCPTDVPANIAARDFINSNTLVHLPLPP